MYVCVLVTTSLLPLVLVVAVGSSITNSTKACEGLQPFSASSLLSCVEVETRIKI